MNAGKGVNVSALLDEAWTTAMAASAQADEADSDMLCVAVMRAVLHGALTLARVDRSRCRDVGCGQLVVCDVASPAPVAFTACPLAELRHPSPLRCVPSLSARYFLPIAGLPIANSGNRFENRVQGVFSSAFERAFLPY